ncbi:Calcium-transporting ATPase 1 [Corynebacterium ciconiae DSM 44920]|uniref:HAD-IC family P-type ATPase n=1 Tax=Corynebacterium ciconiae TaxID=227319 RepID=UPI00037BBC88|nr:HAD-IC family P-type ATPase [Corynebacterium ciconiae]WKD61701.1 Calcium-transporting ATPase 1 [Corynebacterium ciconiae DSM 44920]
MEVDTTRATTPAEGLSSAEVAERRERGEVNVTVRRTGRRTRDIIYSNVFTRINAILGVLFAIVAVTGSLINGAFGLLIIANSSIGIIQELRAKRTLDKLTILGEENPKVVRDGATAEIPRDDIVLDDLIDIGAGDQLVVDGVVRSSEGLEINESMLTGESEPVKKAVGDPLYSGSFVAAGFGTFQATGIGEQAYATKLVRDAGRFTLTDSELQNGIDKILRIITWLLIPTGLLAIYTQLVRTGNPLRESLLAMVAALVPMVPEGLVLMTSIAFAVGVVRLGKHQALVNELPAIEGLARVDVVCADKTGTLTENRMGYTGLDVVAEASRRRPEAEYEAILLAMATADKRPNDTMQAIAEHMQKPEHESSAQSPQPLQVSEHIAFDSTKKYSGVQLASGECWLLGAPDVLAPGLESADEHSQRGERVLLLGMKAGEEFQPHALVILEQVIRPEARATLDYFAEEKVEVKIISGDNAVSVGAVARSLGIDTQAVDARELPQDPEEFRAAVARDRVFGRVTPEMKKQMVLALKESGHTVAMTGDGVNDVLALKEASIGIAMGSGSPAARSVAQLVLLDNRFSTLPHVVAEGRRVIGNIERVANLFLTKTVYSVILALVTGIFGIVYPFQPIHVTMIGWFTIGIPAFILSLAPNHERARPGFVSRVLHLAIPSGVVIGVGVSLWWIVISSSPHGTGVDQHESSAALASLLIMAWWVLAVVSRPVNWWKSLLIGVSGLAYVVLFAVPWSAKILLLDAHLSPMFLQSLAVGVAGAVVVELLWRANQVAKRRQAKR